MNQISIVLLFIVAILMIINGFIAYYVINPFHFPHIVIKLDVSGRRQPNAEDIIDEYLNDNGFYDIENGYKEISDWVEKQKEHISKMMFSKHRMVQFESIITDQICLVILTRDHIRYHQINYRKYPYTATEEICRAVFSYQWFKNRYNKLKSIGYECTIKEYNCSEQRKLMTPVLRKKIMVRDNYTCQICGKYMPDGVGLEIDHIVPVAKGGKTVPSNLQVLCTKCNRSKSDKLVF